MKHTSRLAMVPCPACDGEGGETAESYAGYDSYNGPAVREEWEPCQVCEGFARVHRVERLAWLIGEQRAWEAKMAALRIDALARAGAGVVV